MSTITTINGSDAISSSRTVINANFAALNTDKIETSYLDTDTTLAANSDTKIPSQKAVKAYVDTGGNVNASETTKGIVEEATDAEVTAGTATGATGAKLFITPAKLDTRLDTLFGTGLPSLVMTQSTTFETSGRFAAVLSGGTNTFGTSGVVITTTSTTTRYAGFQWAMLGSTSGNVFLGNPVFSVSLECNVNGATTGSSYFGLGTCGVAGSGHTYTTDHCGFKILVVAGVASLYATQADGTTETTSSALTTVVPANNDNLELMLKINGSTSVDYYWRKNGGSWSTATNLTANMPNTASYQSQFTTSNNSTANAIGFTLTSASYSR